MASREPSDLTVSYPIWWRLFRELRRRGAGVRESGAFLLGERSTTGGRVRMIVFYDDIDPEALTTGIVRLSGHAMNAVWETCAAKNLEVLADVHTHPEGAGQSRSDQEHPMVATRGHVALIAPRLARSAFDLAGVGVYRYRGAKRWDVLPAPRFGWFGISIRGER
ncbi:hypothetical protein [Methylobacterium brachiatum]|jgi:proteasome lid subunit RPN8/RPN11|uniref:hypothetical protein n=1 Tax=Methylobacterium brachiatum TaxID=269660 RepID=UPI00244B8CC7|nr:hypothetical protein [Methylobacterium brachiatum]MDH2313309.1 hypothetical protein [Methylobacterium brachiatum]